MTAIKNKKTSVMIPTLRMSEVNSSYLRRINAEVVAIF